MGSIDQNIHHLSSIVLGYPSTLYLQSKYEDGENQLRKSFLSPSQIGWMDYNLKILFPRFSALLRRIHGFVRPSAYPPPDWGNAPHRRVFITLTSCTTWFEYCTTPLHRWSRVCALPRVAAGPETAVHEGTAECGSRH